MISNRELEEAAKILNLKHFKGVFSKDQLPAKLSRGKYIINMEDSHDSKGKNLPGTHWVYCDIDNNQINHYIDTYGVEPPCAVVRASPFKILYNIKEVQDKDSELCGFYCLYFGFQKDKGRSYQDIMKDFKSWPNTKQNRKLLDSFFEIKSA